MNSQSLLSIMIQARDQASGVLKSVGGSIDNLRQKSQSLARDGFNKIQEAGKAMTAGLMIGIPLLGGVFGGIAIKAGQAQAEVQSLGVQLETAMGGNVELAKEAQKNITAFASKTPYQLGEVTTAFVKLKNMGLDPSNEALTAYGDTASAMGKSLNDMIEAVADAATGEFERLKEFGIKASSQGDKVAFTFKGVTTTVGKNSKEIEKYLINLGKTNFAGGMEKQSRTLNGLFSTLTDTVNLKLASAFDKLGGTIAATQAFEYLIQTIESVDIDAIITKIGDSFNFLQNQALLLYEQFVKQPIYEELQKIWEQIEKAEVAKSLLAGLAFVVSTVVVSAFLTMAGAVIAATWPFVLLGGVAAGLYYTWQTNMGGIQEITAKVITEFQNLWNIVYPILKPAIEELITQFKFFWDQCIQLHEILAPLLIPVLQFLATVLGVIIISAIYLVIFFLTNLFNIFGNLYKFWVENIPNMGKIFTNFGDIIMGIMSKDAPRVVKSFGDLFVNVATVIGNAFNGVTRTVVGSINTMIRAYNSANDTWSGPDIATIPGYAGGTMYAPGGLAMVGENGPELVNLPRGSQVRTASTTDSMQMGGGLNLTLNLQGAVFGDDKTIDEMVRSKLLPTLKKYGIIPA